MTKSKTQKELSEDQLEKIRGGGFVALGTTTVIQEVSANAVMAAALGATSGTSARSNGGTIVEDAPSPKKTFVGGPPVIDKARHDPLLATIRNLDLLGS